jgi:hypothetical protein
MIEDLKRVGQIGEILDMLRSEQNKFDSPNHKRITVNQIKRIYDKAVVEVAKKTQKQQNKISDKKRIDKAAKYKDKLVSRPRNI